MARKAIHAFSLVEMLVAISVLTLVVVLFSRMLKSVTTITSVSTKRIDSDSQERQLLDRIAVDFAQMVKRKDVRYFVKTAGTAQPGNDLIAFFSSIPGNYPTSSFQSPISLVAYRVNSLYRLTNPARPNPSYNKLERMAKGLQWNGSSSSYTPILYNTAITGTPAWSAAVSSSLADSDYEVAAPQVFRFEYYYLLKPDPSTGAARGISNGAIWSSTDTFSISDVAAIAVAIAVVDPASVVLLPRPPNSTNPNDDPTTKLAGRLPDATSGITPGQLLSQWQTALDGVTDMPPAAISGIRLYERNFYLSSPAP